MKNKKKSIILFICSHTRYWARATGPSNSPSPTQLSVILSDRRSGHHHYLYKDRLTLNCALQGPTISQSIENFSKLPEPITPEVLSPSSSSNTGGRRRRVKSPEILETTFTMSTIQEEIENVNYAEQQSMLEI